MRRRRNSSELVSRVMRTACFERRDMNAVLTHCIVLVFYSRSMHVLVIVLCLCLLYSVVLFCMLLR